jgi:tol-pal system protein YbgF
MNDLGEALKAVSSRIEEQTSLERKAFADGKVQMDSMSGDIRVVREKVDETNVRLGTITQELESIRQAIPEPGAMPPAPVSTDATTGTTPPGVPPAATATPPVAAAGVQPQRLFDGAWGDYTAGNYSLAIQGFDMYLRSFPKSTRAHEAQLYIAEALAWEKKDMEAVVAYDRVISSYPGSGSIPMSYYKRGRALERLGETARARESYETLIKQFPDASETSLAKQRLDGLR